MEPFSPFYEIPRNAKVRVGRTKPEDRKDFSKRYITESCELPSGMSLTFDLPPGDARAIDDLLIQDLLHLQSYISSNLEQFYKRFGGVVGEGASDVLELIDDIVYERLQNGGLIKEIPYEEWARNRPTMREVKKEDIPKAASDTDSDDLYSRDQVKMERKTIQAWWKGIEEVLFDIEGKMGAPMAPDLRSAIETAISSNAKLLGVAFRPKVSPKGENLPKQFKGVYVPQSHTSPATNATDQYRPDQVTKGSNKKTKKSVKLGKHPEESQVSRLIEVLG